MEANIKLEENIFYVYIYLAPKSNAPFYVGKGKNSRYKSHLNAAKNKKSDSFMSRKIRKIQRETKQDPEIIFFKENLSEDEAFSIEIELIKRWGRKDSKTGPLLNLTDGGESDSGRIISDEERKRFSERRKGWISWNTGMKMSSEHCQKLSEGSRRIPHTEETKQILREAHLGKKHSEETKLKIKDGNKGQKRSEESKEKMRGRKDSEEARKRKSKAKSLYWENRRKMM